jgi:succinate-semialdehyde dehydrogenase/glutarate-semialdehyde dehydrogenase
MSIQTVNPLNNQFIKSFEEMSDSAIDKAVTQAASTFQIWKKSSYKQRGDLLHKVAKLMREKKETLALMITLEMGKLLVQVESADLPFSGTKGAGYVRELLKNLSIKN